MNKELENKLYQIDPIFFEEAIKCNEGSMNETNTCMAFGCECDDGWFEPLKKLAEKLSILNNLLQQYQSKAICRQIKEKFAEIRIYYDIITNNKEFDTLKNIYYSKPWLINENENYKNFTTIKELIQDAIHTCENECANTCEGCGTKENILTTTSGWMTTICQNCARKLYDNKHPNNIIDTFNDAYNFLNLYHRFGFKYENKYYHSIIEAFYSIKDHTHVKDVYYQLGSNKSPVYLIEKIANEFGFKYEDNESDYNLLKDIVYNKFLYSKYLKTQLLKTYNKDLIFNNVFHHHILGTCKCQNCINFEQKNLYGKILMEVREELYKENNVKPKENDVAWKNDQFYIYIKNKWIKFTPEQSSDYIKYNLNDKHMRVLLDD